MTVGTTRRERIQEILRRWEHNLKVKNDKDATVYNIPADLKELFLNDDNPPEAYFDIFMAALDLETPTTYLFKLTFEAFKECKEAGTLQNVDVSAELQNRVFNTLLDKSTPKENETRQDRNLPKIFNYFVSVFKFDQLDKPLEAHLEMFLSENDYSSAGSLLAFGPLHLLDTVSDVLTDVIVPLFIIRQQEQLSVYDKIIKKLIKVSKNGRVFVAFLDNCMEESDDRRKKLVACYGGMPKDGHEALRDPKKVMKAYIKELDLSKKDFPNYLNKEALDDLFYRFVLYHPRRGEKPELTPEQFEDHVRNAMLHGPTLPNLFVKKLRDCNLHREAMKWEEFVKKPQVVKAEHHTPYGLDGFTVQFVATETSNNIGRLTEVIEDLKTGTIVAMDCENQSTYAAGERKIALLQFAFDKKVFVVDTHSLGSNSDLNSAWKRFFEIFFGSGKHQVFGFGLDGDISNIGKTYAPLKDIQKKNVIKTERLIPQLEKQLPNSEFFKDLNPKIGLKDLYKKCFPDQPEMDKSEQMSCFDRRPLRKAQLDYAARDVIVLLKIFEKFKEEAARETFNKCMESIC
ncbi:hypothetical protein QR680_003837 [Steinernema hermaphroditum]|uniref:3'-5' exonuclease domain-containing protein n=1 Tax=Steinernema hermaphroditum TaxID=289476 RepID=A0AA39HLR2_9BILA|nr:hypothetical protein QR680_003837 [Steinernema hermaphroditum]